MLQKSLWSHFVSQYQSFVPKTANYATSSPDRLCTYTSHQGDLYQDAKGSPMGGVGCVCGGVY